VAHGAAPAERAALSKGGPAGQEGFAAVKLALGCDLPPSNPPHSPLVRGEVDKHPLSYSLRWFHAMSLGM
jgi:hypothetical protein